MKIHFNRVILLTGCVGILAGCTSGRHPIAAKPIPAVTPLPQPAPKPAFPALKPALELTQTGPADNLICDPIPLALTIKNSGGSALTDVQITGILPDGATGDGLNRLIFDAGNLAPGESRTFNYNTSAAKTGQFISQAKATSTEGVVASATTITMVHQPILALAGKAPTEALRGRPIEVTYTLTSSGDVPAANSVLTVPVPPGLTVDSLSDNGQFQNGAITWNFDKIETGAPQNVRATLTGITAGNYQLAGTLRSHCAATAAAFCPIKIIGIPALALQKTDSPDPIAIGELTTYTVKVTNQGSAAATNVAIRVDIAPNLVPISSDDRNAVITGQTVTFPVLPALPPQNAVIYSIVAKGVKAGDGHTKFTLNSAALKSAISAEESTTVY